MSKTARAAATSPARAGAAELAQQPRQPRPFGLLQRPKCGFGFLVHGALKAAECAIGRKAQKLRVLGLLGRFARMLLCGGSLAALRRAMLTRCAI